MIKELLSKGLKYSLDNPQEFARIYKEAFGEVVCSYCPGIIQEKFNKLLNTNEEKIISMKTRKWKMLPGKLIDTLMSSSGPSGQYTDKNITDEIAEQLIAKGYGKSFVKNNPSLEEEISHVSTEEAKEEPISFEVFDKSESKETKDSFDTYSHSRLIAYCNSKQYDKKEWQDLNRKKLIEYIRSK